MLAKVISKQSVRKSQIVAFTWGNPLPFAGKGIGRKDGWN
jgi:hypothetical protein